MRTDEGKKKMGREKFERANAISPRRRISQVQTDRQTEEEEKKPSNQDEGSKNVTKTQYTAFPDCSEGRGRSSTEERMRRV